MKKLLTIILFSLLLGACQNEPHCPCVITDVYPICLNYKICYNDGEDYNCFYTTRLHQKGDTIQ